MRISLIQMDILHGQPEQNCDRVLDFLEKAMLESPDVIVLPEMWNTGYALSDLAELADTDGQKTQKLLSQFAQKHEVAIVGGSVAVAKDNQFFNTTYVYDRTGKLLVDYSKVHLFGLMAEDCFLAAGHKKSQFELDGVKAASAICYDIRFPEWLRTLMSAGAQLLFVVAQWPESRIQQWEILLRARAVENQAFVVAVNRVGDGPDDHFNGHSMIIDPLGNIILQARDDEEGVFTANIDLSQTAAVRGSIPVFEDRRPELYH
ncbi:carbon-nitrogen family hydrolase [Streptococcus dentiloxodontae]